MESSDGMIGTAAAEVSLTRARAGAMTKRLAVIGRPLDTALRHVG